jgi:hypothetical protein
MVDRVVAAGVDEVACLIDLGMDAGAVLAALTSLATLRRLSEEGAEPTAPIRPAAARAAPRR